MSSQRESRGGKQPSRPRAEVTLARVQQVLQETCERDGQGNNLSELSRRKAYRAGINEALALIGARRDG